MRRDGLVTREALFEYLDVLDGDEVERVSTSICGTFDLPGQSCS